MSNLTLTLSYLVSVIMYHSEITQCRICDEAEFPAGDGVKVTERDDKPKGLEGTRYRPETRIKGSVFKDLRSMLMHTNKLSILFIYIDQKASTTLE